MQRSHTSPGNTGCLLFTHGPRRALIVTSVDQAFHFAHPTHSSFDGRCLADLGYLLDELQPIDPNRVAFIPSARVLDPSPDPRAP